MSCVLRAKGVSFAVDEFLARSALKPIAIFRRGEPRLPKSQPEGPKLNASGFHVVASEADFSNLQVQIADAIHFLEQNQGELTRLVAFPGVETLSLDFGIEERDVAAQSERSHRTSCALSVILASGSSSHCTLAKSPTPHLLVSCVTGN